jgi:hypothetical protein
MVPELFAAYLEFCGQNGWIALLHGVGRVSGDGPEAPTAHLGKVTRLAAALGIACSLGQIQAPMDLFSGFSASHRSQYEQRAAALPGWVVWFPGQPFEEPTAGRCVAMESLAAMRSWPVSKEICATGSRIRVACQLGRVARQASASLVRNGERVARASWNVCRDCNMIRTGPRTC